MQTSVILLIILGTITAVSHGAGVLPDRLTATAGQSVTFTTTVRPPEKPFFIVAWSMDGSSSGAGTSIITSTTENITDPGYADRITLFRSTASLELRGLTLKDSGKYTVLIIPDGGEQLKGNCMLMVYEVVSNVSLTPGSTDTTELSTVTLSCSASGSSLSFLWMNGSAEVTASDRVQITNGGATLTINRVSRYDQGSFRCHVSNAISNGTSDPVNLTVSYGPENINFTVSPSQKHFTEGSNISLRCSASSRPAAHYSWLLNGEQLPHTGPELRLMNAQINQTGKYRCQAYNNKTMKRLKSPNSLITIQAPVSNVKVNSSTPEIFESSSGSVTLTCSSSGSSLSFLWRNGSAEVTAGSRVQITNGGTRLTIMNVNRYDQGPYTCSASNLVSDGTSDPVNLNVIYGPENINLTRTPSLDYYDEGADISLKCLVSSHPVPVFTWYQDETLLAHTGPELKLLNVQKSHRGNYSCQAFNNRTMLNQTSQIETVRVRTSEIASVVITPNATDLSEHSSVSLSCSAFGSFPTFAWLNGSTGLSPSDSVQFSDKGATLTIINVTRYDQGPFLCHVYNNFSNGTSDPVKLSVSYGPENIGLKLFPLQQYFEKGSNISMMCSAASRPAASFQWFLNGDKLKHTGAELTLTEAQEEQSGNYSCRAFNSKTSRHQTSQMVIISVQTAVSNVRMVSDNEEMFESISSATLSCSSSGSSLSFLWLNDSAAVAASDRVQITDGGSALSIINATRYDQGPFSCNVSNGISYGLSRAVNLYIQYGPDTTTIEGPESVHVGDLTMLYCSTMSVPPAKITWLFNGQPTHGHNAALVIRSSRGSDSGTYTCTATNAVTGKTQTMKHQLTVVDFSSCDSSVMAGISAAATIGCCLVLAAVCGIIVFAVRKRRGKEDFKEEKTDGQLDRADLYRFSITQENDLYSIHSEVA